MSDDSKEFETLRAAFALRGHVLAKTDKTDEPRAFYASRWGMARHLPNIEEAKQFLLQIGGKYEQSN